MIKSKIYWITKCGVFSGPCFPIFGQNTEIYTEYSVRIRENTDQKKLFMKNTDQKKLSIWTLFTQCFLSHFIYWTYFLKHIFLFLLKQHAAKLYG